MVFPLRKGSQPIWMKTYTQIFKKRKCTERLICAPNCGNLHALMHLILITDEVGIIKPILYRFREDN